MKKFYAQKDETGALLSVIHTRETMPSPWFEVTQDFLSADMVWNESTEQFEEPSS